MKTIMFERGYFGSLFLGLIVLLSAGFVNAIENDIDSLAGSYCISGFDPTLCREAPYNLSGVNYVGTAVITKHVREGRVSYTITEHFDAFAVPTPGGICNIAEQNFTGIGLQLNDQISFALSGVGFPPSINTYEICADELVGKWTYQGDFRVGKETLTKVPNLFHCTSTP